MVLNKRILILNKSWMPINTATVRRAVGMMFNNEAFSICTDTYQVFNFDQWLNRPYNSQAKYIRGSSIKLEVPEVILLSEYNGVRHNVELPFSRQNLMKRDRFTCQYCGKKRGSARGGSTKKLTIDHIIPRCKGGKTTWENCVIACSTCNTKKDDKSVKEAGMKLLSTPRVPKWTSTILIDSLSNPETLRRFARA